MLRGLTTVSFFADDVAAATDWYAELLGLDAYFVQPPDGPPAYVEFRIGDHQHELGILDSQYATAAPPQPPGGAITYWHVDDLDGSFRRLLEAGATVHERPIERGAGFVTASVVDPFGNVLGIMYNQHYLEMVEEPEQPSS